MIKHGILLLLLSASFCQLLVGKPAPLADYDFKGTTNKELIAEIAERLYMLENEVSDLRRQIQTTKVEVFEKHGLYVVQSGDTYSKIAQAHGLEVKELIDLNPEIDPRRLRIGMVLNVKKVEVENQSSHTTPASAPR